MANVLHRTTKDYLISVNTPDFSVVDWIIDPDVSAVAGFPTRYWIITGDVVTLMDQAARDSVDAAIAQSAADVASSAADTAVGGSNEETWQAFREIIGSITRTHNKFALRIRECELAFDAIKNTSGGSDNIRAAIPAASVDVVAARPAPATFSRMQDRSKANEVADFRQTLANNEGQV